jgi:phosphohistidine phosphatase SixA
MRRKQPRTNSIRVIAVRHGPAEVRDPARWPDDDLRPLTRKGETETRRAARGLANVVRSADRLATSSADRAIRTAELIRRELDKAPSPETWEELAPGNMATPIFDRIRRSARPRETVVLVGHEPTLAEFVGEALTGEGLSVVRLTKGGAVCLEFSNSVRPGTGRLVWLLTRKQLAAERD